MKRRNPRLLMLPVLALAACSAAPPRGPMVVAMPGEGKSWEQFQTDDGMCRDYAHARASDSGAAAAGSGSNSVAISAAGTLIGAAAGAALGAGGGDAGAGAAIGAGAGLLAGSSAAGNNAQAAAFSLQRRYDIAYAQCMVGNGNTIEQGFAPAGFGPPPGY